jgi:methylenetetrahydrofolate reductase (NADPH)
VEALESNPEAEHAAGVDYAIQQCKDLLSNGVEGLHFYTLNKSKATVQICKALNTPFAR